MSLQGHKVTGLNFQGEELSWEVSVGSEVDDLLRWWWHEPGWTAGALGHHSNASRKVRNAENKTSYFITAGSIVKSSIVGGQVTAVRGNMLRHVAVDDH